MKRIVSLLLVFTVALGLILVGCGTQGKTPDSSASTSAQASSAAVAATTAEPQKEPAIENGELRMFWWGSEERHKATLEAIKLFESQNPGITIKSEYSGWDGYQDKLTAQIASNSAPDIFQNSYIWLKAHVSANALLPLDGLVDVSGQNPDVMKICTLNNKIYAIPLGVDVMAYLYNKTQLDKYGIEVPKFPYTWDDMAAKFKEIYEKSQGKLYGAIDSSVAFEVFQYFGYTKLGAKDPFPYDNDKLTFTEDQIKAYYQFWSDLRASKVVAPAEQCVVSDDSANSLVVKDIAAFVPISAASYSRFQSQTQEELDMIALPSTASGEVGISSAPSMLFSVFSKTKMPKASTAFVDFFTNSPDAAKLLLTSRGVLPTEVQRQAVLSQPGLLTEVNNKSFAFNNEEMKKQLKPFYIGPNGVGQIFGWKNLLEQIGQEVAFNKISIEDGARKFVQEANKVIETSK